MTNSLNIFEIFIDATKSKNYAEVRNKLASGEISPIECDFRGFTALHFVAEVGDAELLEIILDSGKAKLNCKSSTLGTTPLMLAAMKGHVKIVRLLLDAGADAGCVTEAGWTTLMLAIDSDCIDCVQLLLSHGKSKCNLWATNSNGDNALTLALRSNFEISKIILEANVYDLSDPDSFPCNLLYIAAYLGRVEEAKLLVQSGYPINYQDADGSIVLGIAICKKERELTAFLMQNGADPEATDNNGYDAYAWAASTGFHEFFETYGCAKNSLSRAIYSAEIAGDFELFLKLLQLNKDPISFVKENDVELIKSAVIGKSLECLKYCTREVDSVRFNDFLTFLLIAADGNFLEGFKTLCVQPRLEQFSDIEEDLINCVAMDEKVDFLKYLLELGARAEFEENSSFTPLMTAALTGSVEAAQVLVSYGATVNAVHEEYGSALIIASSKGHLDFVKYLLESGVDREIKDSSGYTALMAACHYGQDEIAEELLKYDDDVNVRSKDGMSPLLVASECGNERLADCFLNKGAELMVFDENGNSVLHFASERKNFTLIKLVVSKIGSPDCLVDWKNHAGESPLEIIVKHGNAAFLFSLLAVYPILNEHILQPQTSIFTSNDEDICAICREVIQAEEKVTQLPCRHFFHELCYDEWMAKRATCPLCQRPQFTMKK